MADGKAIVATLAKPGKLTGQSPSKPGVASGISSKPAAGFTGKPHGVDGPVEPHLRASKHFK